MPEAGELLGLSEDQSLPAVVVVKVIHTHTNTHTVFLLCSVLACEPDGRVPCLYALQGRLKHMHTHTYTHTRARANTHVCFTPVPCAFLRSQASNPAVGRLERMHACEGVHTTHVCDCVCVCVCLCVCLCVCHMQADGTKETYSGPLKAPSLLSFLKQHTPDKTDTPDSEKKSEKSGKESVTTPAEFKSVTVGDLSDLDTKEDMQLVAVYVAGKCVRVCVCVCMLT